MDEEIWYNPKRNKIVIVDWFTIEGLGLRSVTNINLSWFYIGML